AGAFKTASFIFGGELSFILMIVLSFYLAVQEDGVGSFLKIVSPVKHHEYIINLWKRSQRKIGYWMQGQLLLGVIVGVLVYLGLMILGVKNALLLASIATIFEIIPIFGPILAAVPAVLISFVDGGATLVLLVIGLYLIIHQFENHLLYPLVVRKIIGISPIVVILALVIGAKLAGFLGALLAVPIASALMEWIDDVEKDKMSFKKIT
ncbi:MAG: AI-2E family transporter, partial [bacterium]|nr:AI-2E family transporter [bacterium]